MGILNESRMVLACEAKLFLGLTMALIVPMCVAVFLIPEPAIRNLVYVAFYLISTSVIVSANASIYNDINITSWHMILSTVLPRVYKRFFNICLSYEIVYTFLLPAISRVIVQLLLGLNNAYGVDPKSGGLKRMDLVCFQLGLICVDCVWNLAITVTVLEQEADGIKAIKKGMKLIKGKMVMAFTVGCIYDGLSFGMEKGFGSLVIRGDRMGLRRAWSVAIGMAIIADQAAVHLMVMIIRMMIYMECKSYYRERIYLPAYLRMARTSPHR